MGWISYLEDITDRFTEEFEQIRIQIDEPPFEAPSGEQRDRVVALLCRGEAILTEARGHLEIATDPSLNLAAEVSLSREQIRDLKRKLADFESTCIFLAKSVREKDHRINQLEGDVKSLKAQNSDLNRKFEKAFKSDPGRVYDTFSDPKKLKKFKPDS